MKMILFLLLAAACFSLPGCNMENPALTAGNQNIINPTPPPPVINKTPVLVELFTSEG